MPDWLPEFADDDIQTLLEALEAWEVKDQSGDMLGDLMEAILAKGDPRMASAMGREREVQKQKRTRERAIRKEQSVMLRAKLLTLRNRRRVDQARTASLPSGHAVDPVEGTSTD